jgi:hypothetical protein
MPDIASLQNQLQQWKAYYSTQPNGEQQLYQKVAEYAKQQGFTPDVVAQVIQGVAPNPSLWTPQRVQSLMDQNLPAQYGLAGATTAAREGQAAATNTINQGLQSAVGSINSGMQNAAQTINTGTQTAANTVNQGLQFAIPTLQGGAQSALNSLGGTQNQVSGLFNQAQSGLQPYAQQGSQANQLQAALSGALGPEAQKQAYAQYQESPGVDYARSQAEKAITRNASATGGLGGGNVLSELMRNAVGTYLQDFGNQFQRIGQVSDRGLNAAATGAGLRGQEAGIQSNLGAIGAQIPMDTAGQISNLQTSAANNIGGMQYGTANNVGGMQFNTGNTIGGLQASTGNNLGSMNFNTGQNLSGMRYQAGQDLANSVSSTTSALSNLINQQGAGMADITGNATTNLNALYQQASQGDANAMEQLASLLGNISTQSANMVSGLPITQGAPSNLLGQLGQVAGGVGGLAQGLSYGTQPATKSAYTPAPYNPSANVYTNYGGYA